jgi:hypothetical protein
MQEGFNILDLLMHYPPLSDAEVKYILLLSQRFYTDIFRIIINNPQK